LLLSSQGLNAVKLIERGCSVEWVSVVVSGRSIVDALIGESTNMRDNLANYRV
jgi:hypothetical protein